MGSHSGEWCAVAQRVCEVCGNLYESGEVLLQKRLTKKFKKNKNILGYGLCEEHTKLYDDDFVALVVVKNPSNSTVKTITQENAERTGKLLHIRRPVLNQILNIEPVDPELVLCFIDQATATKITEMSNNSKEKVNEIDQ
jgi:hypothetical protein